jgi:plastocyanin
MGRSGRRRLAAAALVVCAGATAAFVPTGVAERTGARSAAVRCSSTVNVKIGDADGGARLFFSKGKVTIRAGSCVRWVWTGVLPHGVLGSGFQSKIREAPFRYRKRFARARSRPYSILCAVHSSMRMKVVVRPR